MVKFNAEKQLSIDYVHYLNSIELPLLRLVEIPFQSLRPGLFEDLVKYIEKSKETAFTQNSISSRCRVDGHWRIGSLNKNGSITEDIRTWAKGAPVPCPKKRKIQRQPLTDVKACGIDLFLKTST